MVKQEVDVSKQEVRFSTTWTSPTESNGGLGLSIGPSYSEIWNFGMAGLRNGDTDSVMFSTTFYQ